MDKLDKLERLLEVVEGLAFRVQAQQYWLSQSFLIMSRSQPGLMAHALEQQMQALKCLPPNGPAHMSPAELDEVMMAELPAILHVGAEISEHLRATQRLAEAAAKRSSELSTAPK